MRMAAVRAVLAGLAGLPAALAAAGAGAATEGARFDYTLYLGGLELAEARLVYDRAPGGYDVAFDARTAGWVSRLAPWQAAARSRGQVAADGARPHEHVFTRTWRGEVKSTQLDYRPDGSVALTVTPPEEAPKPDDEDAVPPDLVAGTLDPVSAVVAVAQAAAAGQGCGGTVPVFDGSRRYDMIMEPRGQRLIKASDYSSYAGPALLCEARLAPLAGHFRKRGFWQDQRDPARRSAIDVWFAAPQDGLPLVPVRVEAKSALGQLVIHLTGAGGSG